MEAVFDAINGALGFAYDNILSIAMMVFLIAAGIFLSARTGFFQFRKFGYVLKNTVGKLFNKNIHSSRLLHGYSAGICLSAGYQCRFSHCG